jgi:hypothetical protein
MLDTRLDGHQMFVLYGHSFTHVGKKLPLKLYINKPVYLNELCAHIVILLLLLYVYLKILINLIKFINIIKLIA